MNDSTPLATSSIFKNLTIGTVFTPAEWAGFAVSRFGLFESWIEGATIFDPTVGEGNLLEALVRSGLSKGWALDDLPLDRLFGNEMNTGLYQQALEKFRTDYGVDMKANFFNEDIFDLEPRKFDIIFGNPPWQNFADLPADYKEKVKPLFHRYGLVGKSRDLLLGGSRIDIAALVIRRAILDFLVPGGKVVFFMPLSLFLNDGAHQAFRTYEMNGIVYSPEMIYDFNDTQVFEGISTRYGLVAFTRDRKLVFPVPFFRLEHDQWQEYQARPLFQSTDPFSIFAVNIPDPFAHFQPIEIGKESLPRQGVNTCGANDIYFFESCREWDAHHILVSNKRIGEAVLPRDFIFPLITAKNFKADHSLPVKWVLLPYQKNGKPLKIDQMKAFPKLYEFLNDHRQSLENRKGLMLNATLSRGFWWAMLGVGAYNFFLYKVVWEAYGKSSFNPKIFEGNWQVNQSLQAYMPFRTLEEASGALVALKNPDVESYLSSMKMAGTMSWAQPGKIRKLLRLR